MHAWADLCIPRKQALIHKLLRCAQKWNCTVSLHASSAVLQGADVRGWLRRGKTSCISQTEVGQILPRQGRHIRQMIRRLTHTGDGHSARTRWIVWIQHERILFTLWQPKQNLARNLLSFNFGQQTKLCDLSTLLRLMLLVMPSIRLKIFFFLP